MLSYWLSRLYILVLLLVLIDYAQAVGYRITFKTASSPPDAGTQANIEIVIDGVQNDGQTYASPRIQVPQTNFSPGSEKSFDIDGYYGVVYKMQISSDNSNTSPNWFLEKVMVEHLGRDDNLKTEIVANVWFDGTNLNKFLFSPENRDNFYSNNLISTVDGQYAGWSQWGACDAACTCPTICQGQQTRTRECADPPPHLGGKTCAALGPASETKACDKFCVVDGGVSDWTTWSGCSKTCDGGVRTRSRTCTNPAPLNGGKDCSETLSDEEACNTQSCIVDGGVSEWGAWSECSKTCATGQQSRTRTCTNPAPKNGGKDCQDPLEGTQNCNPQDCPKIDGGLSQWSNWTECTKTCGTGEEKRTRTCTEPAPKNGGKDCDGTLVDSRECNTNICPDPRESDFSPWSEWTACSATCGGGRRLRSRTCTKADTTNCQGRPIDSVLCNVEACRGDNGSHYCGLDLWLCTGVTQCINSFEKCDGRRHCVNAADEEDCDPDVEVASASLAIVVLIVVCILIFVIAILIAVWCLIIRSRKKSKKVLPDTPPSNESPGSAYGGSGAGGAGGGGKAPLILPPARTARLQSTTVTDVGHYNHGNTTETPYILNLPGNEVVDNTPTVSAYDQFNHAAEIT